MWPVMSTAVGCSFGDESQGGKEGPLHCEVLSACLIRRYSLTSGREGKIMTCFRPAKINLLLPLEFFMDAKWKRKKKNIAIGRHFWIRVEHRT